MARFNIKSNRRLEEDLAVGLAYKKIRGFDECNPTSNNFTPFTIVLPFFLSVWTISDIGVLCGGHSGKLTAETIGTVYQVA